MQIGMGKASEHDEEGRVVTVELDSCFLVNVYVSRFAALDCATSAQCILRSDQNCCSLLSTHVWFCHCSTREGNAKLQSVLK